MGWAERAVQVFGVLAGAAEHPLQVLAARAGVLPGQRVGQVEGVVVVEGAAPSGIRAAADLVTRRNADGDLEPPFSAAAWLVSVNAGPVRWRGTAGAGW